jgi:hypothetical protein
MNADLPADLSQSAAAEPGSRNDSVGLSLFVQSGLQSAYGSFGISALLVFAKQNESQYWTAGEASFAFLADGFVCAIWRDGRVHGCPAKPAHRECCGFLRNRANPNIGPLRELEPISRKTSCISLEMGFRAKSLCARIFGCQHGLSRHLDYIYPSRSFLIRLKRMRAVCASPVPSLPASQQSPRPVPSGPPAGSGIRGPGPVSGREGLHDDLVPA